MTGRPPPSLWRLQAIRINNYADSDIGDAELSQRHTTVQVFLDPNDQEGMNGVVRLTDSHRRDWDGLVWLGDIRDIQHSDSVRVGTSRA